MITNECQRERLSVSTREKCIWAFYDYKQAFDAFAKDPTLIVAEPIVFWSHYGQTVLLDSKQVDANACHSST